ncbi:30S ribosomal protein S12 methylthiotransferase RimO [candidate division KSB1 bacterium]|nr:30S ribosomal protein S12 methylthiotransferase RimO [candidate division KSB1 bacterium]
MDSEWLLGNLVGTEVEFVPTMEAAEVVIINTCGFIQSAKEEALETIFDAVQLKTTARCKKVLVTGCLVARYLEALRAQIPEVDGFYSNRDLPLAIKSIVAELALPEKSRATRYQLTPAHYAYLKIAEGCNNRCSYCAIPLIRGALRSRRAPEILAEARTLVENGVRELIVIAQDTTNYGADLSDSPGLVPLIEQILKIDGLHWLRLMYAHPAHFSDELIDLIAREPKICKYIDLPIQHISDRLLMQMRRQVTRSQSENLIEKLRTRIPGLAIRTSVMVGFPGETEAEFEELLRFVEQTQFDRLGAFTYSPEEETPAFHFKKRVKKSVQQDRYDILMQLQAEIAQAKNAALVQTEQMVLIDAYEPEVAQYRGRTQWDAPEVDNLVWISAPMLTTGAWYAVQITSASEFDLAGAVVT